MPVQEITPSDHDVDSSGISIAVRDFGGTGQPIVILHGAGRTLADCTPLANALVRQHRVVAMDLRNHGRSGTGPWEWDLVLGDVLAVVSSFGLERPAMVGHSLGGMVAAMYGALKEDCPGVVNLDGHGRGRPEQYLGMAPEDVLTGLAEMENLRAKAIQRNSAPMTEERLEAVKEAAIEDMKTYGLPPEFAVEALERSLMTDDSGRFLIRPLADAAEQLQRRIKELDLFDTYRRTKCPLLIYLSLGNEEENNRTDSDPRGELVNAYRRGLKRDLQTLAAEYPMVEVEMVAATHGMIVEIPEQIATRVTRFLAGR